MKRDPSDTDRTFTVRSCEYGRWVEGNYAPTDDVAALLKTWAYGGLRLTSLAVSKRLGALVAVVDGSGSEAAWLEELNSTPLENEGPK